MMSGAPFLRNFEANRPDGRRNLLAAAVTTPLNSSKYFERGGGRAAWLNHRLRRRAPLRAVTASAIRPKNFERKGFAAWLNQRLSFGRKKREPLIVWVPAPARRGSA